MDIIPVPAASPAPLPAPTTVPDAPAGRNPPVLAAAAAGGAVAAGAAPYPPNRGGRGGGGAMIAFGGTQSSSSAVKSMSGGRSMTIRGTFSPASGEFTPSSSSEGYSSNGDVTPNFSGSGGGLV